MSNFTLTIMAWPDWHCPQLLEASGCPRNSKVLLELIRYLQKLRVHRLKTLVGAIHELPLLNSWRCLLVIWRNITQKLSTMNWDEKLVKVLVVVASKKTQIWWLVIVRKKGISSHINGSKALSLLKVVELNHN